jgi:hypothetical protein
MLDAAFPFIIAFGLCGWGLYPFVLIAVEIWRIAACRALVRRLWLLPMMLFFLKAVDHGRKRDRGTGCGKHY